MGLENVLLLGTELYEVKRQVQLEIMEGFNH